MSRRRMTVCGALLICGGLVCWFFPLFHIRPLGGGKTVAGASSGLSFQLANGTPQERDANAHGKPRRLEAYATAATDVAQLWNAFHADTSKAKSQYGRQAGLGGAWYFCVRGQGTVESVEKSRLVLSIADSSRRVCLELGVVVDNTVREAVGIKASEFANSQDFNEVSAELNRQVEQDVIAPNRELLKQGVVIDFVGCAKIGGKSDLDPLCLVPIQLKVQGDARGVELQPRGVRFQLAIATKTADDGKLEAYSTGTGQ